MSTQRSMKNTIIHGFGYEESLESTNIVENDANTSITVWRSPTQHARSGGDWCEIIRISPEIIALIIGDVEGHGKAVAPTKTLIRSEVMKLITQGKVPSTILFELNAFIENLHNSLTATALVAFYNLHTRKLTFANAGHPPPLLVNTENFHFLTYLPADITLGVEAKQEFKEHSVVVPLDALVVFYTDGFTERSHDISQGEQELVEAVHQMHAHASPQAARTIAEHIFRDKPHLDDAALMVLCTKPNAEVLK